MSNNKTPSTGKFNNNSPFNPAPTIKQLRKRIKSHVSQCQTILEILKRDGHISSEQMRDMGYYSGAKRISELKESGHLIYTYQDWSKNGLATYWYKGHIGDCHG